MEVFVMYGHWTTDLEVLKYNAFVYYLEFDNGKKYIGAKKIFDIYGNETDWKTYTSSSTNVHKLLETNKLKTCRIIQVYNSWEEALVGEENFLRENNVLRDDSYLNASIGGKDFNCYPSTIEHKNKLRNAKLGKPQTIESRRAKSNALVQYNSTHVRTKAHIMDNIGARKSRYQIQALFANNKTYKSIRSAALDLNESECIVKRKIKTGEYTATYIDRKVPSKIVIDGESFSSYKEAAKAKNVTQTTITNRCLSDKFPTYQVFYKSAE